MTCSAFHTSSGSSPLTRGTLPAAAAAVESLRFIPTHAGNTGPAASGPGNISVHPHSRGEHASSFIGSPRSSGSSPLTRGTLRRCCERSGTWRFIPTHAGNTTASPRATWSTSVHPHSRGEHSRLPTLRKHQQRFIPTHAGNTACAPMSPARPPVHPHSRGEHEMMNLVEGYADGSSPLTRGTPDTGTYHYVDNRFIPTHAGNTSPTTPRRHR